MICPYWKRYHNFWTGIKTCDILQYQIFKVRIIKRQSHLLTLPV